MNEGQVSCIIKIITPLSKKEIFLQKSFGVFLDSTTEKLISFMITLLDNYSMVDIEKIFTDIDYIYDYQHNHEIWEKHKLYYGNGIHNIALYFDSRMPYYLIENNLVFINTKTIPVIQFEFDLSSFDFKIGCKNISFSYNLNKLNNELNTRGFRYMDIFIEKISNFFKKRTNIDYLLKSSFCIKEINDQEELEFNFEKLNM